MPLRLVTTTGAFTQGARDIINGNFSALQAIDYWVRPQAGVGDADGTYEKAFSSFAALGSRVVSGVRIGLEGVCREEYVFPLGANDVTVIGARSNQPRQATTSGVANGGGATWMSPAAGATSTTTPLITVRGQSTTLANIYINSTATAAPAISLLMNGAGDPPLDASAEHANILGCFITGAHHGVTASGGPNFVTIDGCRFFGFSGGTDTAISSVTGAGVHSLYGWEIKNCEFQGNIRHITIASSGASIHDNHFSYINNGVTTAIFYDATGGTDNAVFRNAFDVNSGNAGIAAMFVLGTNDRFSANSLSTAVTTTQFSWGDPA